MRLVTSFEAFTDRLSQSFSLEGNLFKTCLFLLLTVFFLLDPVVDRDLFARVAVGRLVEIFGTVPFQDPFAFTPKKEIWVDHEWLAGVVFYYLASFGGDLLLFLFKLFFCFLTLLMAIAIRKLEYPDSKGAPFWTVFCSFTAAFAWGSTVRAQVFTYFFFMFLLLAVSLARNKFKEWLILALPLVFLCWANAHGGFVVGLGIISFYLLMDSYLQQRISKLLLLVVLACYAACSVTPYGPAVYFSYITDALVMKRPTITEWQPLQLSDPNLFIYTIMFVISLTGLINLKNRKNLFPLILLTGFFIVGVRHQRFMPFFALSALIYGLSGWNRFWNRIKDTHVRSCLLITRSASFVLIISALAAACFVPYRLFQFRLNYKGYPLSALRWLRENNLPGNLLVDFNNGSYALWRLYPKIKISLDGRYEELYPESTVNLVSSALNPRSENFQVALKELNPDYILLKKGWGAYGSQHSYISWYRCYDDGEFAVLIRNNCEKTVKSYPAEDQIWKPLF
ncbi:MAG: hypothetical protein D6719_12685 [Candidatus Dadabacteria bacterium]|nr:MAG: hypothetical protein D6719_12685 [Candidatus Dadabacteria bacterium]